MDWCLFLLLVLLLLAVPSYVNDIRRLRKSMGNRRASVTVVVCQSLLFVALLLLNFAGSMPFGAALAVYLSVAVVPWVIVFATPSFGYRSEYMAVISGLAVAHMCNEAFGLSHTASLGIAVGAFLLLFGVYIALPLVCGKREKP